MQRKFIINLFLLLFLTLLVKPFWILGIDRAVQNQVGAEEYGFYYSLLNFSFLLNILLDVGITSFNNRNIAQHSHLVTKHVSAISVLRLLLGGFYIIVTLLAAFLVDYSPRQLSMLALLGFNQFLLSFILYLRSNLAGLQWFKTDGFISVLDRLLMIGICAALLWGGVTDGRIKIEWFVYAQTAAYFATFIVAFALVLNKTTGFKLSWNKSFCLLILKQSAPYALLTLLMTIYFRIDVVMLERMLPDGASQAGIYAQAFRLLDAVSMIGYLVAALLLPMFSRMVKQQQTIKPLSYLAFSFLIVVAIPLVLFCWAYASQIMGVLYTELGEQSVILLPVLMIAFIPLSITYVFGTLLTAKGEVNRLNVFAFAGVVINILLNFYFIPSHYALGSAIASVVTLVIIAVSHLVSVQYLCGFKLNMMLLMRWIIFVALMLMLIGLIGYKNVVWQTGSLSLIIASPVLAVLLRLVKIPPFSELMNQVKSPE